MPEGKLIVCNVTYCPHADIRLQHKCNRMPMKHVKDCLLYQAWNTRAEGIIKEQVEGVKEKLAEYAHIAWSGWMKYLFKKCSKFSSETGEWIMPAWAVDRWQRQMNTEYKDLSEEEKNSDRDEADKMLEILMKLVKEE